MSENGAIINRIDTIQDTRMKDIIRQLAVSEGASEITILNQTTEIFQHGECLGNKAIKLSLKIGADTETVCLCNKCYARAIENKKIV